MALGADDARGLDRNLSQLGWLEATRSSLFWLPSFFLLFQSILPVDQVLAIASIYYAASVLLEVPSGYLSDRVGRRTTLVIGTGMQAMGCFVVAAAHDFTTFAIGQALLAGANAFFSGTDTSLLYESLRARGREAELATHEARVQRMGLVAMGVAAIAGGWLGSINLRLPHLATGIASVVAMFIARRLTEPPSATERGGPRPAIWRVLRRHAGDPVLRWILAFAMAAMVFNHVPFEFLQPYIASVAEAKNLDIATDTPRLAGLVLGATMLIAAYASRTVAAVHRRLGHAGTMLAGLGLQTAVIATLSLAVHPLLAVVLVLRSVPQALTQPVMRALIHPRVDGSLRATWLSLQSLAGRMAFSASLIVAAGASRQLDQLGGTDLLRILRGFAVAAAIVLVLLALTRPRELRSPTSPRNDVTS